VEPRILNNNNNSSGYSFDYISTPTEKLQKTEAVYVNLVQAATSRVNCNVYCEGCVSYLRMSCFVSKDVVYVAQVIRIVISVVVNSMTHVFDAVLFEFQFSG
jgi:hypothetical protein